MEHILESQQFDTDFITHIFNKADDLQDKNGKLLEGKILASLFYEPSTRTRFSFESAMMRLGGNVLTTENAAEFSSAAKGETIEDTIRVTQMYSDVIVLRHPEVGSVERAAKVANVPIINAGDGVGQHPTQALLDLYTIYKERGEIDGVKIAMVGDLLNGRTVHSLSYLLGKYHDVEITYVSLPHLQIPVNIKDYLVKHGVVFYESLDIDSVVENVDVLYQTRIQKERFTTPEEFEESKDNFVLTRGHANRMRERAIIMHPLPRNGEIKWEVDSSDHAKYFTQAKYGLYIRMALLTELLLKE